MSVLKEAFSPASGGRNQTKTFSVSELIDHYRQKQVEAIAALESMLTILQTAVDESQLSTWCGFEPALRRLSENEGTQDGMVHAGDFQNVTVLLERLQEQGITEIDLRGDQSFVFQIIHQAGELLDEGNQKDLRYAAFSSGVYTQSWQKYINR